MIVKDARIFIPSGKLPNTIQIGNRKYHTRDLLKVVEEITRKKILRKYDNQALRHYQNNTLQIPVILNTDAYDPLQILGKDKIYLLTPKF